MTSMGKIPKYYHASPVRIGDGQIITPSGDFPLGNCCKVEKILNAAKPEGCLSRKDSVYASTESDFTNMNHGLRSKMGFVHIVEFHEPPCQRDNQWVGELQKRCKATCGTDTAAPCHEHKNLCDQQLAQKYWSGEFTDSPNVEFVGESAQVVGATSKQPQQITQGNNFDAWL
jgi:hypothetical protein